jgi:hypothetical protein
MTLQQLEERKAEKEIFDHLRAVRRRNRKERERMGSVAYDALKNRAMLDTMEDYCRKTPGVTVVKVGNGYMFVNKTGSTQP